MAGIQRSALVLLLFLTVTVVRCAQAKKWGLLVSSANGWNNYGMQADVLHAYQIMKEGGIPDEQIVVMIYDDIAESSLNPFKGQVFQSYDLKDVYKGAPKDYTGEAVTKKTFMAVLQGDRDAVRTLTGREGKVIDSGPDDNIFVFISDHGAPGVVCWWDDNDMTAKELNETITSMHEKNKYRNMIIYTDTCFSGSMFENILPDNIGVYAATAANATYYAFSADCDSSSFPLESATCLGGLFSINWVYEAESDDRTRSTMDQQFREAAIACEADTTPRQYGDLSIAKKFQEDFLGNSAKHSKAATHRRSRRSTGVRSTIPKHMMAYHLLQNRLSNLEANSEEYNQVSDELHRVETLMIQADQLMKEIPLRVYGRFQAARATREFGIINWNCYEPVLEAVRVECPGLTHREEVKYYAMSQFGVLINLCSDAPSNTVLAAVREAARASPLCRV